MDGGRGDWGGRREGAGRKPTWKSGPCKAVKIPVALVDEVMRYARQLDAGAAPAPASQAPAMEALGPIGTAPGAAPTWLEPVKKRLEGLPKRETRLMVLHLLVDHQAYVEERLREHEKRGLVAGASERARAQWQQGRQAQMRRIQEMGQLFAAFPPELIAEARALRVANWRSRASVGARRSYDAILARINDASS